eukprot:PhF_6_TR11267/c0_g1_i2/m.18177
MTAASILKAFARNGSSWHVRRSVRGKPMSCEFEGTARWTPQTETIFEYFEDGVVQLHGVGGLATTTATMNATRKYFYTTTQMNECGQVIDQPSSSSSSMLYIYFEDWKPFLTLPLVKKGNDDEKDGVFTTRNTTTTSVLCKGSDTHLCGNDVYRADVQCTLIESHQSAEDITVESIAITYHVS